MTRISRRVQLLAFGGVALVFALGFVLLRPVAATLSDEEYIAIAKSSFVGQYYFRTHDDPCRVIRVWNVQVTCDHVEAAGAPTEKFRVYIDPRTNRIIDVDMTDPPPVR